MYTHVELSCPWYCEIQYHVHVKPESILYTQYLFSLMFHTFKKNVIYDVCLEANACCLKCAI